MQVPRRRDGGFTLVEILVVISIIAALIGLVASAVSRAGPAKNRLVCTNNLRNMGALLQTLAMDGKARPIPGPGYLLQLRQRGEILQGDERVFLCPQDPAFAESGRPGFEARYARLDLERPGEGLCSYVVRDFRLHPLRADSPRKEPVACCPHHGEGVVVLYADGSVLFIDREKAGVEPGAAVPVGPSSPAEDLRVFPEFRR